MAYRAWASFGFHIRVTTKTAPVGILVTPFVEASYLVDHKEPGAPMVDESTWKSNRRKSL